MSIEKILGIITPVIRGGFGYRPDTFSYPTYTGDEGRVEEQKEVEKDKVNQN